ncbi:hypothetical protein E2562_013086 [Oryza meyeriana var. granulata]|uniref:Uncharacterized protein n=1 Tax=Oryza meyeriana var. granulata TaxID=110450 RepID=A0A6G1F7P3_9ORYZ|nr:hypothetical protein E2562_013086 [Oryza meyeriana var. granulata]
MDHGKNPAMAGTVPEPRADAGSSVPKDTADDFEFCVLSSGGLVPAGAGAAAADMCVADEVFSQGKLLPLRPSSAAAGDAPGLVLFPRSESVASTVGFGSRSDSRSASSSGSSSGCVSRSQSAKSASSDHSAAPPPPRRSLSSSLFYAHPSPSPQLRTRPRRSTGSAPLPATAWGIFRLGVVGAPDVYPPRSAESKNAAAAASAKVGSSRSARFEPPSTAAADKKPAVVGLFPDGFGCKCSPDVVETVTLPEAAKRAKTKVRVKKSQSVRRSRILDWLEELTITKEKK